MWFASDGRLTGLVVEAGEQVQQFVKFIAARAPAPSIALRAWLGHHHRPQKKPGGNRPAEIPSLFH